MQLNYEKLEVIELSRQIVGQVYQISSGWPNRELYGGGLGNQARRASVSIVLNIAEGSGGTKNENARFVRIAIRSTLETRECLILAKQLGYQTDESIHQLLIKLYFKLINLRNSLLKTNKK